ncbi:strictosidine synthase family protein [Ectothiorhodospiraceae bacterium WFHF3C12]|nr:strictosidine synthase family protein [Ectothiorhodospiraceae bacterium WFHF3C12]
MKKLLLLILLAILAGGGYLMFWPTPLDPVAYNPPAAPTMEGRWAPNTKLRPARRLAENRLAGPEDLAVDSRGRLYTGTDEGLISRIGDDGDVETLADTGGRPLGVAFGADGRLLVADAWKGLLAVDEGGDIEVLSTGARGTPFAFTDDLDVADDGTVYFSDASDRFHQPEYLYDLLEARAHGRLLRYEPATGETTVLADDLYFANGVAVSEDERFVLVNETYRYRIRRHWLSGPRAGETEVIMDNLPGFPDNIARSPRGTFWVAFFTVRNERMDAMHPSPLVKEMVSRLPKAFWPKPAPYGFIAEIDGDGNVLRTLQDPGGERIATITSVLEHDGTLYLGSLYNRYIGRLPLPEAD